MASLSSLGLNLRLADIDENLKSHPAALSWPNSSFTSNGPSISHDFIDDAPCFAYTEVFERYAMHLSHQDSINGVPFVAVFSILLFNS